MCSVRLFAVSAIKMMTMMVLLCSKTMSRMME